MNLTSVRIRQVAVLANVRADSDFRQPRVGNHYQAALLTLRCQVSYGRFQDRTPSMTGDKDATSGHLIFKDRYLERQGVTLGKGDRIEQVRTRGGWRAVSFRITEVAPTGHLPHPGLVYVPFEHDREERETP